MGLVRNIAKNTLAMGSVQLASQLSTFVLSIFLTRYLGSESYGVYTYAFAFASLVFIVADFGLGFQMVVEVAPDKSKAPQYLTNTLFLRAMLGGVAMLVTIIVVILTNPPPTVAMAILVIAASTGLNWLTMVFTSTYTAYERMHYVLLTTLIERMFTVSLAIVLLVAGYGLPVVVTVVLIGSMLNLLLSFLVTRRYIVKPARWPSFTPAKQQFRRAIPYAISGIMMTSLYSVNAVLLKSIITWTGGTDQLAFTTSGFYTLSFNLIVALISIPTIVITALLPVISRLYHSSTDLTRLTQQKMMKYMFSLGMPIAVGGIFLGGQIIVFIYGPNFAGSAAVFRVLAPVVAITYLGAGIGSVLASANLIRLSTIAAGVGAGLNVALCFLLIPFLQERGAALAFTLAMLSITLLALYFMSKYVFKVSLVDIMLKPIVASLGMAVVLVFLQDANLFVSLAVGAGVYFFLMFALKALDKDDKEILVKILKKGA